MEDWFPSLITASVGAGYRGGMKNTPPSAEAKIQLILRDPLHSRHRPPTKAARRNATVRRAR